MPPRDPLLLCSLLVSLLGASGGPSVLDLLGGGSRSCSGRPPATAASVWSLMESEENSWASSVCSSLPPSAGSREDSEAMRLDLPPRWSPSGPTLKADKDRVSLWREHSEGLLPPAGCWTSRVELLSSWSNSRLNWVGVSLEPVSEVLSSGWDWGAN